MAEGVRTEASGGITINIVDDDTSRILDFTTSTHHNKWIGNIKIMTLNPLNKWIEATKSSNWEPWWETGIGESVIPTSESFIKLGTPPGHTDEADTTTTDMDGRRSWDDWKTLLGDNDLRLATQEEIKNKEEDGWSSWNSSNGHYWFPVSDATNKWVQLTDANGVYGKSHNEAHGYRPGWGLGHAGQGYWAAGNPGDPTSDLSYLKPRRDFVFVKLK